MRVGVATMPDELVFEVFTALGFRVELSTPRWQLIVGAKHPVMFGREREVAESLRTPDEIRRSRSDADVYLFYRQAGPSRWICVVVKNLGDHGFVITTYPTDTIKEGESIWVK